MPFVQKTNSTGDAMELPKSRPGTFRTTVSDHGVTVEVLHEPGNQHDNDQ